jgi:FHS family L-fucose permease-like MFS transporter
MYFAGHKSPLMKSGRSLATLISVFFFWGFVAASNTILIGLFKRNFELSQFQSQLVDLAFYAAYAVGSLAYFFLSVSVGDPLNKIGYKKGLVLGLCVSAIGALGFVPAGMLASFPLMLTSLFVIGLGFALQQIVANPYVIALGNPATGAHRVSLAGGINSFGTTIGPLLLALAVYGNVSGSKEAVIDNGVQKETIALSIERTENRSETVVSNLMSSSVVGQYREKTTFWAANLPADQAVEVYKQALQIGSASVLLSNKDSEILAGSVNSIKTIFPDKRIPILTVSNADALKLSELVALGRPIRLEVTYLGVDSVILPSIILAGAFLLFALMLGMSSLPPVKVNEKVERDFGALRYPQLIYGMVAIFVYVGVEVSIQSNLPEFMRQSFGREADTTVHLISLYWGGLMIGRWVGAINVFNPGNRLRKLLNVIVPFLAYGLILFVNYLKGSPMDELLKFAPFILVLIGGFYMSSNRPAFTMFLFGLLAMIMLLTGLLINSTWSVYFFISGGLFCSVMWPCIFSLSIAGLGKYTTQGSSLLIMMILGGALIPPLQGYIADFYQNIRISYVVPVIGFAYLAFYGLKVKQILNKQGIEYDSNNATH